MLLKNPEDRRPNLHRCVSHVFCNIEFFNFGLITRADLVVIILASYVMVQNSIRAAANFKVKLVQGHVDSLGFKPFN
jgi:hypothetical protein